MLEPFPVAGRAAHVRRRDGVAARDEVLRQRAEARRVPRLPLALRPAVHGQHDRERPVSCGQEEEDRDRLAVEALEPVQLRLHAVLDIAEVGQLPRARRPEVVHPHLIRLDRRRERERHLRSVRREDEVLRNSVTRQRHAVHPRVAVLVRGHEHAPAGAVAEAREIPIRLVHDLPAASEGVARDGEGVAALVRRAEEAGRVGEPDRIHVLRLTLVRRHVDDLAALDAEQEQVRCRRSAPRAARRRPTARPARSRRWRTGRRARRSAPPHSRVVARRCRSRGRCGDSWSTRAARRRARRAASGG